MELNLKSFFLCNEHIVKIIDCAIIFSIADINMIFIVICKIFIKFEKYIKFLKSPIFVIIEKWITIDKVFKLTTVEAELILAGGN